MEFGKINLEKSWNFLSDLKLFESNFSRAMHAFQASLMHYQMSFCPVINLYMD